MGRVLLAVAAFGAWAGAAAGQPLPTADAPAVLTPGNLELNSYTVNNFQSYGYQPAPANNYTYTLVNAGGAAGAGYTTIQYGETDTQGGALPSSLTLRGTAGDPTRLAYATAGTAANGTTVGPPAVFDRTVKQYFNVFQPAVPGESFIQFDIGGGDYAYPGLAKTQNGNDSPTDTLDKANALLNSVLKFDASAFYDPTTNAPIATGGPSPVGVFSFRFDPDYFDGPTMQNPTGNGFTHIDLVFTPVPEPGLVLAVAAVGLLAVRRRQ